MNFEAWHCTRHAGKLCPAEGCPAVYGCAIDRGWSQGQPSPRECKGFTAQRPPWLKPPAAWRATLATVLRVTDADVHPAAWFAIVAAVSFTVGALVF